MDVLEELTHAMKTVGRIIKFGAGIQEKARNDLTNDLQQICLNCEKAYDTVLKRLGPIKDAFQDPPRFAKELRDFATDTKVRKTFKPEHLCGEIDHLIVRLESNLDPLKYSIDRARLQEIRGRLGAVGMYDAAIYRSYDQFARELDNLATQLQVPSLDAPERSSYAQHVIMDFETDLRSTIDGVRETKNSILKKG